MIGTHPLLARVRNLSHFFGLQSTANLTTNTYFVNHLAVKQFSLATSYVEKTRGKLFKLFTTGLNDSLEGQKCQSFFLPEICAD